MQRLSTWFPQPLRFVLFLACFSLAVNSYSQQPAMDKGHAASFTEVKGGPEQNLKDNQERWDQLSLEGQPLHADAPIRGEVDRYPEFTRELLRVQWRPDDPIDLYVVRPVGIEKPPVILYLYGYPTDSSRFLNNDLCRKLTEHGFAAVGFVSALTGPRYHDRPLKEWFVSELQESLATSVHDVQMILNYLDARQDLDTGRVGMFGEGSGGSIAILAAGIDSRIKVIDVLDPWGDWPDWLAKSSLIPGHERTSYLTPEFLARIAPLDPILSMSKLSGRPFRLQEALFDRTMPSNVRDDFARNAPARAEQVNYQDLKSYQDRASANGQMLLWIKQNLQNLEKDAEPVGVSVSSGTDKPAKLK